MINSVIYSIYIIWYNMVCLFLGFIPILLVRFQFFLAQIPHKIAGEIPPPRLNTPMFLVCKVGYPNFVRFVRIIFAIEIAIVKSIFRFWKTKPVFVYIYILYLYVYMCIYICVFSVLFVIYLYSWWCTGSMLHEIRAFNLCHFYSLFSVPSKIKPVWP